MRVRTIAIAVLAILVTAAPVLGPAPATAQGKEVFIPLLVYRTGPYAPSGIPIANGFVDYFTMLNERDGGVNGVKIAWEECETQYDTKQGVECYERLKGRGAALVNPYSTGITYQLMLYLRDRFGAKLLTALHRDKENHGLAAVQAALPDGVKLHDVLHDFQVMTLVDKVVDEPGGVVKGALRQRVTSRSVRSTVNLDNPSAFGAAGAAPNGADFLRLPDEWETVTFEGARSLPSTPLAWTMDAGMLFSGNTPSTDAAAVRVVDVPATDPKDDLIAAYETALKTLRDQTLPAVEAKLAAFEADLDAAQTALDEAKRIARQFAPA